MISRKVLFAVVLTLLVSLIATGAYAAFQALAVGGGNVTLQDGTPRTFSVFAKVDEDGSVFGFSEAEDTGDVYRYARAEIDCFNYLGPIPGYGEAVFMSGWVVEVVNPLPGAPDPIYAVFGVVDGGQGPGTVDFITSGHQVAGPEVENCHNTNPFTYYAYPVDGKVKVITR